MNIVYTLDKDEWGCGKINIYSDSETISVSDSWAENENVEWDVLSFNKDSNYHNLTLNYDKKLEGENEVEVCVKGGIEGEYHGAITLSEEKKGNSKIKVSVWLKVLIGEEYYSGPPQEDPSDEEVVEENNETEVIVDEEEEEEEEEDEENEIEYEFKENKKIDRNNTLEDESEIKLGMTGGVINEGKILSYGGWIFSFIFGLIILLFLVNYMLKKDKNKISSSKSGKQGLNKTEC